MYYTIFTARIAEVTALKFESPKYTAVILCVAAVSIAVLNVQTEAVPAVLVARVQIPKTVVPSKSVTMPVAPAVPMVTVNADR